MFYQTYTARKLPKVPVSVHSRHLVTPGSHGMVPLLLHVICSVRRMRYNALSVGMTQQFVPVTLTFGSRDI